MLNATLLIVQRAHAQELCELPKAEIRGEVQLPSDCIYERGVKIFESDTTLNCNGSTFDGHGQETIGVLIDSQGRSLRNVKVENCIFKNFVSSAVRITWTAPDSAKGSDRDEIYRRSPTHIVLSNLHVTGTRREGIYIDDYVSDVTIRDSIVEKSGSTAIYLEHSSRNNKIVNNTFRRNGIDGRGIPRREAIAVDSSASNVIDGNRFEENGLGGIFLYKNCGERIHSGKQVIRWQHSNSNQISSNRFLGEDTGIWIASRQSKDMRTWDCGDEPMDGAGRFFRDYADENLIVNNEFCDTKTGIRLEGDRNQILNNRFGATRTRVEIPVTQRQILLHSPPTGNKVSGSSGSSCQYQ